MTSRGIGITVLALAGCAPLVSAQLLNQRPFAQINPVNIALPTPGGAAADQRPMTPLWVRNELTGQIIHHSRLDIADRANDNPPVVVFNNYDNPAGRTGLNLNWNYAEAYTDTGFVPAPDQPPLAFAAINIASDPTDYSDPTLRAGDEKLSILLEPWTAASWPDADLNVPHQLANYTGVCASRSDQFEIRMCRVYFFSLQDVNLPFDSETNKYEVNAGLQFAFVSFAGQYIASPFGFNLTSFDPPITTKGKGIIMTHWLRLASPPACDGDLNYDEFVDDADFAIFAPQYSILDCADPSMPEGCAGDINYDGFVDDLDFQLFIRNYNNVICPEGPTIRKVYSLLAGGRYNWNTTTNQPIGIKPEPKKP